MGCRYIYSIYDAKSGALVAKGDAAKLVGLGLFRDQLPQEPGVQAASEVPH